MAHVRRTRRTRIDKSCILREARKYTEQGKIGGSVCRSAELRQPIHSRQHTVRTTVGTLNFWPQSERGVFMCGLGGMGTSRRSAVGSSCPCSSRPASCEGDSLSIRCLCMCARTRRGISRQVYVERARWTRGGKEVTGCVCIVHAFTCSAWHMVCAAAQIAGRL